MQDPLPQIVGVVGSGAVAKVVAQRLSVFCRVVAFEPRGGARTMDLDGVDVLESLEALAKRDAQTDPFATVSAATPESVEPANDNAAEAEARAALIEIYKGLR